MKIKEKLLRIISICVIVTSSIMVRGQGNCLNFDGVNDNVIINTTSLFNFGTDTSFTIESWAKTTLNSNIDRAIFRKGNTVGAGAVTFGLNSGKLLLSLRFGGTSYPFLSNSSINDGNWHHLAVSVDRVNSKLTMYIDGVKDKEYSSSDVVNSQTTSIILAQNYSFTNPAYLGFHANNVNYFLGEIDEFRVWMVNRSDSQIVANYLRTLNNPSGDTTLHCYYNFDLGTAAGANGTVATLTDVRNIPALNGTLTNFALSGNSSNWVLSNAIISNIVTVIGVGSNVGSNCFQANWSSPSKGTVSNYFLDVSENSSFSSFVNGFQNLNVGNSLSYSVNGLTSNKQYFYRVRAVVNGLTSNNSASASLTTSVNNTTSVSTTSLVSGQIISVSNSALGGIWTISDTTLAKISSSTGSSINLIALRSGNPILTNTVQNGNCFNSSITNFSIRTNSANSLIFVGTGTNSVEIPHHSNYNLNSLSRLSIEFWIRCSPTTSNSMILSKGNNNVGGFFVRKNSSNRVAIALYDYGNDLFICSNKTTIADSTWHHIAIEIKKESPLSYIDFYVDGSLDTTISSSTLSSLNSIDNLVNLTLGKSTWSGTLPFSGELDELRIWKASRGATQIASNYLKELESPSSENDLISYFNFNQGVGDSINSNVTILTDFSNTANHGVLTGFSLSGSTSNWSNSEAMLVPRSATTSELTSFSFKANWLAPTYNSSAVAGYFLDVATDVNFNNLIAGYSNVDVGNVTSYTVGSNIFPSTTYYYRVRSYTSNNISSTNSPTSVTTTLSFSLGPNVLANSSIASGTQTTISNSTLGGVWSSNSKSIAQVDSLSGVITGIGAGTTSITYTYAINGVNYTFTSNITVTVSVGNALAFDGIDDVIELPASSNYTFAGTNNSFTIETWLNIEDNTKRYSIVSTSEGNTKNSKLFGIGINSDGVPSLEFNNGSTYFSISASGVTDLRDGQWHHVAVSLDKSSSTIIFVIDGIVYSPSSTSNNLNFSYSLTSSKIYIGGNLSSIISAFIAKFKGRLDELRIWNSALSTSTIISNYYSTVATGSSGLVTYLRFDQGISGGNYSSIIYAADLTGNGNNGTLLNFNFTNGNLASNWVKSYAMLSIAEGSSVNPCSGSFTGSWAALSGETPDYYVADLSTSSSFNTFVQKNINVGSGTSYRFTGLSNNTTYYYRIKAFKSGFGISSADGTSSTGSTSSCSYTWTGATSSIWGLGANWSGSVANSYPDYQDNVIIANVSNRPILSTDAGVRNITINSGAFIQLSSNLEDTFTIYGNFTNNSGGLGIRGSNSSNLNLEANINTNPTQTNLRMDISTIRTTNVLNRFICKRNITLSTSLCIQGELSIASNCTLTTNSSLRLLANINGISRISQIGSGGSISGFTHVEMYIPGGRRAFRFFGHPFSGNISLSQIKDSIFVTGSGGATNGFDATTSNSSSVFSYSNSTGSPSSSIDPGWTAATSALSSNQSWGKGFGRRILVRGDRRQTGTLTGDASISPNPVSLSIFGNLNDGTSPSVNLTRTNANSVFTLVANPLSSNIDLSLTTRTNVGNTVYIWDSNLGTKGAYQALNISNGAIIGKSTSFFASHTGTIGGASSIVFPESCKTSASSSIQFRKNNLKNLKMDILGDSNMIWDKFNIYFSQLSSSILDENDAIKFHNPELNFYSLLDDGTKFSIDYRPIKNEVIPLGFTCPFSTKLKLSFKGSQLPENTEIYLLDGNKKTLISDSLIYEFKTEQSSEDINKRFAIQIGLVNSLHELVSQGRKEYNVYPVPNNGTFFVSKSMNSINKIELEIFDQLGRLVANKNIDFGSDDIVKMDFDHLSNGTYYLLIKSNNILENHKIIINK